jgi:hypothetical protein
MIKKAVLTKRKNIKLIPVKDIKWEGHFYVIDDHLEYPQYRLIGFNKEYDEFYSWASDLEKWDVGRRREQKINKILNGN